MKGLVPILLATLTTVLCQDDTTTVNAVPVVFTKPKPVGIIYLIQVLSPQNSEENENAIPREEPYQNGKVLLPLKPFRLPEEKKNLRKRRSPGYGGGGGGCNVCGGGGGGYPGGGGGGYPGGGGGIGGGGGHGSSGAWSQSSSSAGGWGSGGGGGGKGKYGK